MTSDPFHQGRIIAAENVVELAHSVTGLSNPTGLYLAGTAGFTHAALRKNFVRDVTRPAGTTGGMRGISVSNATEAIIEDNILQNVAADQAVRYSGCASTRFFNNQDASGSLLRALDTSSSKYALELEDSVQDVLVPL